MEYENIGIICQARLSSSRLPGKVLYDLGGINSLGLIHKRFKIQLSNQYKFIIATSDSSEDKAIEYFCEENKINCFKGSLENVLKRYLDCSQINNFNYIVRITSDCPLLDFNPIPNMLKILMDNNFDYISNTHSDCGHVPDGFDIEIFSISALKKAFELDDLLPSDKEHVTFPFLNKSIFSKRLIKDTPTEYSNLRLTLDEPKDYKLISSLIKLIGLKEITNYSMYQICDFIIKNDLNKINDQIKKNKGWESSFKKDLEFINNKDN